MKDGRGYIRIGGGAAGAEERIDPAVELAEKGDLDYLCFDSLSEVELSSIASNRSGNPDAVGYDAFMGPRLRAVLPACVRNGVRIIGNMGAGDPMAAQALVLDIARELGIERLKVAAVLGDNVLSVARASDLEVVGTTLTTRSFGEKLISAHAYIPCDPIVEALRQGADVVLTGRVGDASLFLAPLLHEFGWGEDWDLRARGIVVGHLLECGAQVTGGYFADPPYKVVPDMHRIGFPIADVHPDGTAFITKVEGSGGLVSPATCREQMLYEVADPECYIEADVVTNFVDIDFEEVAPNRVRIVGAVKGRPRPEMLKVSLGVQEGFLGSGLVYYGGPGAYERASLAADTIARRIDYLGIQPQKLEVQLLGINAMYRQPPATNGFVPQEVGVRTAALTERREDAITIARESSTALSNNGPAAVTCRQRQYELKEVIGYHHTFLPARTIQPELVYGEL